MNKSESKKIQGNIAYISDLHGNKKATKNIVTYLAKHPVQAIVLGGDTPDFTPTTLKTQLTLFLSLQKPLIVFPGSHENSELYEKTLKEIKNAFLIDGVKQRKIQLGDFDLLIVPGSDTVSSGKKPFQGGNYKLVKEKNKTIVQKLTRYLQQEQVAKKVAAIAIKDTIENYNKKRPSIIFAHIPLACKTNKGIDVAQYGTFKETFSLTPSDRKKNIFKTEYSATYTPNVLVNGAQAQVLKKHGYPVILQKKNVGSPTLKKFAMKKNIRAYVCGHIHEAGPKAITPEETTMKANTWTKKVFINNGPGSEGHLTLLSLNNKGEVKYQFVNV